MNPGPQQQLKRPVSEGASGEATTVQGISPDTRSHGSRRLVKAVDSYGSDKAAARQRYNGEDGQQLRG